MRGYHVALEGAQKLKEVSYIHAEAYPAAELKHGPLALVSEDIPTVVIAPDDELWDKNMGSIAEIRARGGPVVAVTDSPTPIPGVDGHGRRADDRAGAAADPARRSRSSCSPTTWRWPSAVTSTSPATWPRA